MMGRQTRRFLARLLTVGIIVCCCFTFFPKINLSSHTIHGSLTSKQAVSKEREEKPTPMSFAQAAREMKLFSESNSPLKGRSKTFQRANQSVLSVFNSATVELPASCHEKPDQRPNYLQIKASVIVSLFRVHLEDPVLLLYRVLRRIPDHVTDDVIITAEKSLPDRTKLRLEEAVDFCTHCRLFFLGGTVYQHLNLATKFSREQKLIFVDARVTPADGWIEPLLFELNFNPWSVASPVLHLYDPGKSVNDVGTSRLELTWDLHVIRAPLTPIQQRLVQKGQATSVNQTSILKEVFAVRKDFFTQLGLFDIIPGASGGEHVSLSLKVLNCGGEIVMPVCSRVFLELPPARSTRSLNPKTEDGFTVRDYPSPSFSVPRFNVSIYYDANSKIWLDSFSTKFYSTSAHRQIDYTTISKKHQVMSSYSKHSYVFSKYGRYANALKSSLVSMECELTNFRYVATKFQTSMTSPPKKTTHFGYVRSVDDGLYALGLLPDSPFLVRDSSSSSEAASAKQKANSDKHSKSKHSNSKTKVQVDSNWLIYTRNSSLWVGPFSYVQGTLQFKRIWCVTKVEKGLALQVCQKNLPSQTFLFVNGVFRLAPEGGKSCVKYEDTSPYSSSSRSEGVSKTLVLLPCDTKQPNTHDARFVMDMTFIDQ